MTISIRLSPEIEQELRKLATDVGQAPADYVRSLVERQIQARRYLSAGTEEDEADPEGLAHAVAAMTDRTPEQIARVQAQAIAALKPRANPPPGTNGMQLVYGQWPGEETDKQVAAALKELS